MRGRRFVPDVTALKSRSISLFGALRTHQGNQQACPVESPTSAVYLSAVYRKDHSNHQRVSLRVTAPILQAPLNQPICSTTYECGQRNGDYPSGEHPPHFWPSYPAKALKERPPYHCRTEHMRGAHGHTC